MKETLEQENARLKKELAAYRVDTLEARSYVAIQRYIEENNKLLMRLKIGSLDKKDRDDILAERARKYSLEMGDYIKMAKELAKGLTSELIENTKKEYAGSLEQALGEDDSE